MTKNEISNHGMGLGVRLTADNLSSIPRRNNVLFLSDYLQEQHSYAKGYASEGVTAFSSWNYMASPAPKTTLAETSTALDEFLLGTPVLKARVPAPVIEISSTILKALDSTGDPTPIIDNQASWKTGGGTWTRDKLLGLNVAPAQDNTAGNLDTLGRKEEPKQYKKRTKDELGDCDEERLKRLHERRERKRLKKGIMRSPSKASESEKENPAQSMKKGSKKDKTKSTSFALMHGFTATNVGKSRITLGPLFRNVGVFKKGRASSISKTGKRRDHDVCFSEARFLGSARAKAIKNIDSKSSASSFSSSGVHEKKVVVKHKEKRTVPKKSKRIDEESVEDPNYDRKKSSVPEEDRIYDPANSISWDIERESYVEESEAGCHQGTIVLSFPCVKSQVAIAETLVVHAGTSPDNPDATFVKTSGDSLHPSQPTSQVLRGHLKAQGIGIHEQPTFSKYFVSKNITTNESDGYETQDEGHRSITLPEPRLEKRSMFRRSPPRNKAHLTSPTLSQMISLNFVDQLPRPYDAFSLADVRSIFEYDAMELDGYDGPDAAQELDFRSRSGSEHVAFEPSLHSIQQLMLENPVSDNAIIMEQDFYYKDLPVADSSGLPDECCHQNLHRGGSDGVSEWDVDRPFNAGDTGGQLNPGNDTFSVQPSDIPNLSSPSVDGSSEYDNCVGPLDHFSQGRSLLYGLNGHTRVSDAEAEVAKLLKQNHWLPYRL